MRRGLRGRVVGMDGDRVFRLELLSVCIRNYYSGILSPFSCPDGVAYVSSLE